MPTVKLYQGMPAGPQIVLNCLQIDFDQMTAGTHFDVRYTAPFSFGDEVLQTVSIMMTNAGITQISGYDTAFSGADRLLPDAVWSEIAEHVYSISGSFTPETIGVKPADWDARWKDSYYTRGVHTAGADTAYIYTAVPDGNWNSGVQYYRSTDNRRTYYTANGSVFGVGRDQSGTATVTTQSGALWCNKYGGGSAVSTGNPFLPMWYGSSGVNLLAGTLYSSIAFRCPTGNSSTNTFNISAEYRTNFCIAAVKYNDEEYAGICQFTYDSYGYVIDCGLWITGKSFWFESGAPGQIGDWGEISAPSSPTRTPVTFSNSNSITNIPTGLQATNWGGAALGLPGGLNVYVTSDANYGGLIADSWRTDLLDTIMNRGWRPTDYILSALRVPDGFLTSGSANMSLGGRVTNISANFPYERVYTVHCGYCTIDAPDDTYLDYDASIELYLPFIGVQPLDVSKVMGCTLELYYRIDIITGDCLAVVETTPVYPDEYSYLPTAKTVLLTASGHCGFEVPISRTDGGINQKLAGMTSAITAALAAATGNAAAFAGSLGSIINSGKMNTSAKGLSGGTGAFGHLKPYVWIKYPIGVNPAAFNELHGRRAALGGTVGTVQSDSLSDDVPLSGFQVYSAVDLDAVNATDAEKLEIERLLKEGVYL